MKNRTTVCGEYQQLLQELTSANQLCAEYDCPFVHPIDSRKRTPEHVEQLRDEAVEKRIRVETRVFIHRSTCLLCLRSP
jgi:hypothetical protein